MLFNVNPIINHLPFEDGVFTNLITFELKKPLSSVAGIKYNPLFALRFVVIATYEFEFIVFSLRILTLSNTNCCFIYKAEFKC
jgi:hypothetical protein